jgi:hypothetical protein
MSSDLYMFNLILPKFFICYFCLIFSSIVVMESAVVEFTLTF